MAWIIPTSAIPLANPNLSARTVYSLETVSFVFSSPTFLGNINITNFPSHPLTQNLLIPSDYFNLLYNNIWITQEKYELNFIVNTVEVPLTIWNAYLNKTATITAVNYIDLSNVQIIPSILTTINPTQSISATIEVDKEGEIIVNGNIEIVTDIGTYYIKLTGIRVILLPFIDFISDNLTVEHKYLVGIFKDLNYSEQRSLLSDKLFVKISGEIFIDDEGANWIKQNLEKASGVFVGVPYTPEALSLNTDNAINLLDIPFKEDVSDYYYLYKTNYILMYDKKTKHIGAYTVSYINAEEKYIEITTPVREDFYKGSTYIFPMLICKFKSFKFQSYGSKYSKYSIELEEANTNL